MAGREIPEILLPLPRTEWMNTHGSLGFFARDSRCLGWGSFNRDCPSHFSCKQRLRR